MKGWGLVFLVWLAAIALVLTVLSSISESQAPQLPPPPGTQPIQAPASCVNLPACMVDMVTDLREYRQWLEEQLSLCKTLNRSMNSTLNDKQKEIDDLKKRLPPPVELPRPEPPK